MPRKAKTTRKRTAYTYDFDAKTVQFVTHDGTDMTVGVNGLPADVHTFLALKGAASILSGRKDPVAAWNEIRAGSFTRKRRKTTPFVAKALYALRHPDAPLDEDEAQRLWDGLSEAQQAQVKADPAIKREIAILRAQAAPAPETTLIGDLFDLGVLPADDEDGAVEPENLQAAG